MKFTIRFADQLVGILITAALAALVTVIVFLGSGQRWFAKDYQFVTYFDSAAGLSKNMAVLYKGFTIGRVKSFDLTQDDRVEVRFYIFDTYITRVRRGSLVDISISPVGLGNQFHFYAGLGLDQIEEGEIIPAVSSAEGKRALDTGIAYIPKQDDSIGVILSQVNLVLTSVETLAKDLSSALEGTGDTTLGRTLGNIEETSRNLTEMPAVVQAALDRLLGTVDQVAADVQPILTNLQTVSGELGDPGGTVARILDPEGPVYTSLVSTLESVSGTVKSVEKTAAFVPAQLPQIAVMLDEAQRVLRGVEDTLTAILNNPLLKNGVGNRVENQPTGTSIRDIEF
ncbi:MAG: MlaD family protein [Treponema sp.]|jgi:phospholipid/cholesterol/gamma-HCH transport system substrate-binding protein|nr:MlaD family protein [Treponema sp.]